MGGDNFDKSSKGEIIDFYEADRLFREYVESEYDKLIWDIHELIKRDASNGETTLRIVKMQGENIEQPVSGEHPPLIPGLRRRVVNGFFFAEFDQPKTTLGSKLFSAGQVRNAQDTLCDYFKKLGYDILNVIQSDHMYFDIKWDRVDRRKFP